MGVLDDALAAEGLDQPAIDRVWSALRAAELTVAWDRAAHEAKYRVSREKEKAETAAAGLAAAIPYTGAIEQCQQTVTSDDVWWSRRCHKKAKFARRSQPQGIVMVVCATHVKLPNHRLRPHTTRRGEAAVERVEKEYQPE